MTGRGSGKKGEPTVYIRTLVPRQAGHPCVRAGGTARPILPIHLGIDTRRLSCVKTHMTRLPASGRIAREMRTASLFKVGRSAGHPQRTPSDPWSLASGDPWSLATKDR